MKILAIETATEACSVALSIDAEARHDHRVVPRQHAQLLLPMIDSLMQEAGLRPQALDGVVFGQGPGSFTGVRIAAAVVQGMALGADIGVHGVSTLATIAQGCARQTGDAGVHVALDARMNEIYWGAYALDPHGLMQCTLADRVLRPEAVAAALAGASGERCAGKWAERIIEPSAYVLAGSGAERYLAVLRQQLHAEHMLLREHRLPDARDLLTLGLAAVAASGWQPPESAVPVYLRNRVALTEAERAAGETLN